MIENDHYRYADIHLPGNYNTSLSYWTDIPNDWLTQAIFGLETGLPITVYGMCEPGRELLTFTDSDCHVIYEVEDDLPAAEYGNIYHRVLPIGKIDFCKALYHDLSSDLNEWSLWHHYIKKKENGDYPFANPLYLEVKETLATKLERLKEPLDQYDSEKIGATT